MIKKINLFKVNKKCGNANMQSSWEEPKMSVEKWYELQHRLRLQQMAQARAAK